MTYTITFALHSRRVCAAVARSFSSMITNVPRVRCNFSGVWKIDASTPRLFLQTSRTLSCKSHKCQHQDCFYKCHELSPANHTDVSKQRLFLQMTEVPSCKLDALSLIWKKNFSFWHHIFHVQFLLFWFVVIKVIPWSKIFARPQSQ